MTTDSDPTTHRKHPSHPNPLRRSRRMWCESTAATMIESAPRGVTMTAGAYAYAAKLATSPTIMVIIPPHHSGSRR
jgi:hypothetical protein